MVVATEVLERPAPEVELSPKAKLRQWIHERIAGKSEVDPSDLLNKAVDHFLKDQAFLRSFLKEMLRPILYFFIHQEMVKSRSPREKIVPLGGILTNPQAVKDRANKLQAKWINWLERTQDGTQKSLMIMTREELQYALDLRRKDIAVLSKRADFEAELIGRLTPGQKVGALGVETIENIAKKYGL